MERIGTEIERVLPSVAGTRSAFAERTSGGFFVDFNWKRDELAHYGLSMDKRPDGRDAGRVHHEHQRLGRLDCPDERRCRHRRLHAAYCCCSQAPGGLCRAFWAVMKNQQLIGRERQIGVGLSFVV